MFCGCCSQPGASLALCCHLAPPGRDLAAFECVLCLRSERISYPHCFSRLLESGIALLFDEMNFDSLVRGELKVKPSWILRLST